jgi:hypothetical protein
MPGLADPAMSPDPDRFTRGVALRCEGLETWFEICKK